MYTFLVIVQVLSAVALVGLILIQHGKGADAGAAFGSGSSGTVFGSRGSANFLSRSTAVLATVFLCTCLALAYLVHGEREVQSVVDKLQAPADSVVPAVTADPTAVPVTEPAAEAAKPAEPTPVVPE